MIGNGNTGAVAGVRPLSADAVLHAWELGQHQHPIDRALTLLRAALPERTRTELAALSLGDRDRLLLAVRDAIFGVTMRTLSPCPRCGERAEFAVRADELREPPSAAEQVLALEADGIRVRLRLPNSVDMAAVVTCGPGSDAERLLLERCVIGAEGSDGDRIEVERLPPTLRAAVEERLSEADPLVDVTLDLGCSACGARWTVPFDIAAYLWTELAAEARRLLGEVHVLARHYGWREADILDMTPLRRRSYLEMIGAGA